MFKILLREVWDKFSFLGSLEFVRRRKYIKEIIGT